MSKHTDILSFQEVAELLRIIEDAPRGGELNIQLGEASLQLKLKDPNAASAQPAPTASAIPAPAAAPASAAAEPAAPEPTSAPASNGGKGPSGEEARAQGLVAVESPMAGIFYHAPAPGEPPFVHEGDTVEEGQQVGIIEVMKLMNRIVAPCVGVVKSINLANEELAEFGAVLMWIEPAEAAS